ncbi:MAG TPA: VCBS repeat-containing protein [Verrucomicrobiales bacterium]|nr:VCBS repeat-containing protein [Verrucomicrobiales bacterium]
MHRSRFTWLLLVFLAATACSERENLDRAAESGMGRGSGTAEGGAPVAAALPRESSKPEIQLEIEPEMATLPELVDRDYVGPLADAYSRIDPASDGWDTEAFTEAAVEQLGALAEWLAGAEQAPPPLKLAPAFVTTAWYPEELTTDFEESGLRIRRSPPGPAREAGLPEGPAGFSMAARAFRQAFAPDSLKVKFKLYRVEPEERRVRTRIRVEAAGAARDESHDKTQIVAEWDADWLREEYGLMLAAIDLLSFEESVYSGSSKTLFEDRTAAVFGATASYRDQLLHSADHWRARLSRDLGLDVVANHGLAMGDVNGDLLDDLYLCMEGGLPNRLYLRNPDGTLRDSSAESGADWLDYCASALIADFNNDGHRDLVVGQEWRLLFMENDGSGRFDLAFGIGTAAQTFSLAAADYDGDGDLDLYACGYNASADTLRRGAMGEPMPYHDARNGGPNMLLRNDGNWEFTDVTRETGLEQNNDRYSFAAVWEDYDNDGDLDLYVANDYGRNNLYKQENGRFRDVASALGVEDMSSGMSVTWGDYNRDGWMDLYVSNMFSAAGNRITYQRQFKTGEEESVREVFQRHARGNTLFEAAGQGNFRDVSVERNVTMGRWAWASTFVDFNNDGWQDLVVANGFITAEDSGDL